VKLATLTSNLLGSRAAVAEQVPHAGVAPLRRGYTGFGMVSRGG